MHIYNLEGLFCKVRGSCIKVMLPIYIISGFSRTGFLTGPVNQLVGEAVCSIPLMNSEPWLVHSQLLPPLKSADHLSTHRVRWERSGFLGQHPVWLENPGTHMCSQFPWWRKSRLWGSFLALRLSRRVTWAKWNCSSYLFKGLFLDSSVSMTCWGFSARLLGSNKDVRICGWLQK